MKKLSQLFIVILIITSCSEIETTQVTIVDCINETGESIEEDIPLNINGKSVIWKYGTRLNVDIPLSDEDGFIDIVSESETYRLIANSEKHKVNRIEGLDLILSFEKLPEPIFTAQVAILDCIDESGGRIQQNLSISINRETFLWTPDSALVVDIPVSENDDTVFIEVESNNYRLISQNVYSVTPNEGLDILLEFETLIPDAEPIVEVKYGSLFVISNPSTANISISDKENSRFTVQSDTTLNLIIGTYRWTASADGYNTKQGQIRVNENVESSLNINLDKILLKGRISSAISPKRARVELYDSAGVMYELNRNQTLELVTGVYTYTVSSDGFLPVNGEISVESDQDKIITHTLESVTISELMQRIRNINSIIGALNLLPSIPVQAPALSAEGRFEYYDTLVDFGIFLFRGDERDKALELFELILEQDANNYRARFQYASFLNQITGEQNYEKIRSIIRPLFGQLLNLIPADERMIISYQSRFMHAETYYNQFKITGGREHAARGIAELEDVIRRYENLQEREQSELEDLKQRAIQLREILKTELGI